jgi:hypothetical protein
MPSAVQQMLDSFFPPQWCPTSTKDKLPFNKSQNFSLSLQLSTFTSALLWGRHLLCGRQNFHKIKVRETFSKSHNGLNTTEDKVGLTEGVFVSIELHNVHTGI